jgi:catechol-2,3-dioxygenase
VSEPRVIGLNGVGLQVPDVAVAEKFYGAFGLEARRRGSAVGFGASGGGDAILVLPGSGPKRMHHLSFIIRPGDEERFSEKIHKAGLKTSTAPDGAPREGLWFQDPWGTWINLSPGASPYQGEEVKPEEAKVDHHKWKELNRDPKPLRIGHMLVFTPDYEKAEAFYTDVVGLQTADRAKGKVSFMSAGDGLRDHHCFGLIPSTHRGYQHASFKVTSIDDIGFGAWRMRNAGYKESFGPGRHALASNLFHYFRDPWGSWIEYYCDMDRITDAWQCRDWSELPYIWGPEWAPEFWGKEMNGNFEPK